MNRLYCLVAVAVAFTMLLYASSAVANSERFLYAQGNTGPQWPVGELTEADAVTGANQRITGLNTSGKFILSPNGQNLAYQNGAGETEIMGIYGGFQHKIIVGARPFAFNLAETKLLVGSNNSGGPCAGLCWVDLSNFTMTLVTKTSEEGTLSPDGTHITWSAAGLTKQTEASAQVFVANADGSSPKQVTSFSSRTIPTKVYEIPEYGPNNTIAFWGSAAEGNLWVVKTDGTGLTKVPNLTPPSWFTWTPGGQLNVSEWEPKTGECGLYVINPDGTGKTVVPASFGCSEKTFPKAIYRQPSTAIGFFDVMAARFEPVLRFDSSESWRPLNVELFIAEQQHYLCDSGTCGTKPLVSISELNNDRSTKAYLNIAGTRPSEGGSEETYHSPYSECTVNGLRDCDMGVKSAIYYRAPGIYGGYEYIDYWYFYRLNYFYENIDLHEGDWEGATVAPSLESDSFDYAAFSQHGTYYSYLRSVLRCEDNPAASLPEKGTCGPMSKRIDDLVANGDHANYTTPCKEELPTSCQQNGAGERERGYDGAKRWGRAYEEQSTALLPMPATGGTGWTDWPGKWGLPAPELSVEGEGPASPGNQSFKVECATLDNEPGCTTGPRTASLFSSPFHPVAGGGLDAASPGLTAVSCTSWTGQGVSAVACNPNQLRHAVLSGHVGSNGSMHITIAGESGLSASGNGIAQFVGNRPLSNGMRVELTGHSTKETKLLVHVRNPLTRHLMLASFQVLAGHAATIARAGSHITLRVHLKVVGRHMVLSLGKLHPRQMVRV